MRMMMVLGALLMFAGSVYQWKCRNERVSGLHCIATFGTQLCVVTDRWRVRSSVLGNCDCGDSCGCLRRQNVFFGGKEAREHSPSTDCAVGSADCDVRVRMCQHLFDEVIQKYLCRGILVFNNRNPGPFDMRERLSTVFCAYFLKTTKYSIM